MYAREQSDKWKRAFGKLTLLNVHNSQHDLQIECYLSQHSVTKTYYKEYIAEPH